MAILKVTDLRKRYKNGTEALKGVSFEVQPGEFYALLGPNGAGKTTAIGIISGLVNKSGGEVTVNGYSSDKEPSLAKEQVGLVPQEFNFNIFETPANIIINQAGYYGIKRAEAKKRSEKLLKQFDLWEKRDKPSRSLSGGMKRKLMIARALVHDPQVLILDEPTAGVDVETRREMWEYFREVNNQGKTIILTTHYLEEAEQLCKNITILHHGEVLLTTSIKELLMTLDYDTFVLDVEGALGNVRLEGFECESTDDHTLEVTMRRGQSVNDVIVQLDRQQIKVKSMRNKTNRLEELFIHLTKK